MVSQIIIDIPNLSDIMTQSTTMQMMDSQNMTTLTYLALLNSFCLCGNTSTQVASCVNAPITGQPTPPTFYPRVSPKNMAEVTQGYNPINTNFSTSSQYNAASFNLNSAFNGKNFFVDQTLGTENKMSKSDMNLELLKEYEYETKTRIEAGDDKPTIVYVCKYKNCSKEFTRTWNILDHARMHKGIKPYQCDFCSKGFTQKGNLRKHMKTHLLPEVEQRKRYK